ncbi:N-acetylneuraminate synthase family protein [Halosolutus amylolyticus]|uniref:N-acetylneuraminate synthase family protein n=1 Tax=Halosolutus amylolyticus TaxID=2932267 RepID=A0ABD5PP36_9EURY|nr:N-acetylneuraminate synthase family protein [Halosolutus amylolyticus]
MMNAEFSVGSDEPTYVIAEAGSNHNGDLETAMELVDAAADAGADAVKFQTFRAESMYVENSGTVETPKGERALYDIVADAEMPYEWIPELHDRCRDRNVDFLSSPFDERSVDELEPYVPAYKVASSVLSHHPFLETLAERDKPIVASTGAHDLADVREAVETMERSGVSDLVLLHCVSSYPTPLESANVRAVRRLAEEFDVPVGLSDHTLDPTTAPTAAVALGADVVEKHFTLDSSQEGLDHSYALEPDELTAMIDAIQDTETALGTGVVTVQSVEEDWYESARRTIHAARDISEGSWITSEDISILRSGHRERGLEPKHVDDVVGSVACTDIEKDQGISLDDFRES